MHFLLGVRIEGKDFCEGIRVGKGATSAEPEYNASEFSEGMNMRTTQVRRLGFG